MNVTSAGVVSDTITDILEFDAVDGMVPKIVKVSNQIYAVAYEGTGNDGWLATFNITDTGEISNSVISTYEFDGGDAQ